MEPRGELSCHPLQKVQAVLCGTGEESRLYTQPGLSASVVGTFRLLEDGFSPAGAQL